ncbi:ABC transporter ATP-binding protein [Lacticigenium naphthae]|uniref:ABC transporter ATP-binding protein n=1 Tax=Lacticigenium naphthae TaxID=515351 RepID=UPI00040B3542|nr:ABC transporter ATP-binding protein [Lacticigenium naphthae]
MIRFENVSKEYTVGEPVVSDFSLEIKDQEFFVLIGPSGSGKTTTLKMINRLISLTNGFIRIDEKPISDYNLQELRWNIGYVLQQIALFPNMTVEENIRVVPEMKKWDNKKMHHRVTELLESVGLDPEKYRHRKISELSGGEQQRIGVLRALAADPDIILMDEPFSALDPISKYNLQQDVVELQRKLKKTVVFVTHDMQEAITLADRICLMNHGKIEQIGTPDEILAHPKNDFVKKFLQTGLPDYKQPQTVQSIMDKGFYSSSIEGQSYTETISSTAKLNILLPLLAQQAVVGLLDEKGEVIGLLSQRNYIEYLAQEQQGGTQ